MEAPPPILPRTSAPGHWSAMPHFERPKTPEFEPVVARAAKRLESILVRAGRGMLLLPSAGFDMVCPGIAVGEAEAATDLELMREHRFTHVLNTCEGSDHYHVDTGPDFYEGEVVYAGFPADDRSDYDISRDFDAAIKFIGRVVAPNPDYVPGGGGGRPGNSSVDPVRQKMGRKVMVHCKAGASRSASVVLAYLVSIGVPLSEAVTLVRRGREIAPNRGFLNRLVLFERRLRSERGGAAALAAEDAAEEAALAAIAVVLEAIGVEGDAVVDSVYDAACTVASPDALAAALDTVLGDDVTISPDTVCELFSAAHPD